MYVGVWLRELFIERGMDLFSLITELAIDALAKCAYQKPSYTLYRTYADEYVYRPPILYNIGFSYTSSLITDLSQMSWQFA